eukprot:gene2442-9576_t
MYAPHHHLDHPLIFGDAWCINGPNRLPDVDPLKVAKQAWACKVDAAAHAP